MRLSCFCLSLWFAFNDSFQPEVSVIKCHQLEGSESRLTGFQGRLQGEVHVEAERKGSVKLPVTPPVCDRDPGSGQCSHKRPGHAAAPSLMCLGSLDQSMTE